MTQALLTSLLQYKASADAELLDALAGLAQTPELQAALRTLNHVYMVDRIFAANLQKRAHTYSTSWSDDVPPLPQLSADLREIDSWYVDFAATLDDDMLGESIEFTFTDGGRGRMTRAEMLAHIITHDGYHRGEIGSMLPEISAVGARDVFTGYLHRSDPSRRG